MVSRDHCGDEFSNEAEMAKDIDFEDLGDRFLGSVQEREASAAARVIDQNGWHTDLRADQGATSGNFFRGDDIALEEGHIGRCVSSQ